jgi:hypothetical protein
MKTLTSYSLNLAAALLIAVASATVALAQAGTDTCAGLGTTIGGTCTPVTNPVSGNNNNTALGSNVLVNNTTGGDNTAIGVNALVDNISGGSNTATGVNALFSNTTGESNTATGVEALFSNTMGANNTAIGSGTLGFNTIGGDNTAAGVSALGENTTGGGNTASGSEALVLNTSGSFNSASGADALFENTTGNNNTAAGENALLFNTTGGNNVGIGNNGGSNLTTGDNNIDIFDPGVAGEANTIRIGTQGTQTVTFVAGIFGGATIKKGCDVEVDATGMLGCAKSSARYKRDIRDMGDASDKLMKLRPVTFQYKGDSSGVEQYGLIAEEVEKVYPELVVDNKDGKAETVAYQVLPAMLLNEVQKERRDSERKTAQIAKLSAQIAEMKASMREQRASFEERLSRIEQTVASRDGGRNIAAVSSR